MKAINQASSGYAEPRVVDSFSLEHHTLVSTRTFANPAHTRKTMTSLSIPPVTLVLGGARSGKSSYAEKLVTAQATRWIYLATATAGDSEMEVRIRQHQQRRGDGWQTVEEPVDLAASLHRLSSADSVILVDCLTLWLSNLLHLNMDVMLETKRVIACLSDLPGRVVLVTNEVGLGIVPENALARRFRDDAGRLNQAVAAAADAVVFVAAGLPLYLKSPTG